MLMQQVQHALAHRHPAKHPTLMRMFFGLGGLGLFLIATVDSSVVPLPVPGSTDILLVLLSAHHGNWVLLAACAIAGSLLGGYFSFQLGMRGGLPALERYVSPKYLKAVCGWVERHAVLGVALPALLPPPMPLSPFIVAAGALGVARQKFLITFGVSRAIRYLLVAWLGYHYGRRILRTWNHVSDEWSSTVVVLLVLATAAAAGWGAWRYWKTQKQTTSSAASQSVSQSSTTA